MKPVADQVRALFFDDVLEEVKDSDHLYDDLGMDEELVLDLILAVEEKFSIDIPSEDVDKLRNIADLIAYVERRVQSVSLPTQQACMKSRSA